MRMRHIFWHIYYFCIPRGSRDMTSPNQVRTFGTTPCVYNAIAVLRCDRDTGFQKRAYFYTLIVGLAGDQTRITRATLSSANLSAIH
jgi:hypothetical protein